MGGYSREFSVHKELILHACNETTQSLKKKHPRGLKGTIFLAHMLSKLAGDSNSQSGKLPNSQATGGGLRMRNNYEMLS